MDCAVAGKHSGGCSLDGTDDYLSVADNNSLDFTTAFTIAFWYKRSASGVQTMVGKWLNTGNQQSYALQVHTDNKIYFGISGTGTVSGTVPASIYNSATAFGTRYNGGNYFNGRLDELRLYNRALSPAEVSALYNLIP